MLIVLGQVHLPIFLLGWDIVHASENTLQWYVVLLLVSITGIDYYRAFLHIIMTTVTFCNTVLLLKVRPF